MPGVRGHDPVHQMRAHASVAGQSSASDSRTGRSDAGWILLLARVVEADVNPVSVACQLCRGDECPVVLCAPCALRPVSELVFVSNPRVRITLDAETRPVWESALRAAAEVAAWPAWKRGE